MEKQGISYIIRIPKMRPLKIETIYKTLEGKATIYLGIVTNHHLRWKQKTSWQVYCTDSNIWQIFIDIKQLKILYKALVKSNIQYGIVGKILSGKCKRYSKIYY